jgi:hypothetical protein
MTDPVAPHLPPLTVKGILFGNGPRFARDAFGPVASFYVLWKLWGLAPGIVAATTVALVSYRLERRAERPGLVVRIALVFVLAQAVIGLWTGSAEVYLAIPLCINICYGLVFIGSIFVGRPLAGIFAEELMPLPDEVKQSRTHRRIFGRITLAWGVTMVVRSSARLFLLITFGVDVFVASSFLTGFPITGALLAWSIWYGVRGFRNSEEWGPAIIALEEAALEAEFDVDAPPEKGPAPQS